MTRRRKRTRTQRETLRCFRLLEVGFDRYEVLIWHKRCVVRMEVVR